MGPTNCGEYTPAHSGLFGLRIYLDCHRDITPKHLVCCLLGISLSSTPKLLLFYPHISHIFSNLFQYAFKSLLSSLISSKTLGLQWSELFVDSSWLYNYKVTSDLRIWTGAPSHLEQPQQ